MINFFKALAMATPAELAAALDSCKYVRKELSTWALFTQWDLFDLATDYADALEDLVYNCYD